MPIDPPDYIRDLYIQAGLPVPTFPEGTVFPSPESAISHLPPSNGAGAPPGTVAPAPSPESRLRDLSVSPRFLQFANQLYNLLARQDPRGILTASRSRAKPFVPVRAHVRKQSPVQRAIQLAAQSDLITRDKRGRFKAWSPKLKRAVQKMIKARARVEGPRKKLERAKAKAQALKILQ